MVRVPDAEVRGLRAGEADKVGDAGELDDHILRGLRGKASRADERGLRRGRGDAAVSVPEAIFAVTAGFLVRDAVRLLVGACWMELSRKKLIPLAGDGDPLWLTLWKHAMMLL